MKKTTLAAASLIIGLGLSSSALAGKERTPLVLNEVTFADDTSFPKIKAECELPEKFHRFLASYVRKKGYTLVTASAPSVTDTTPRLSISINSLLAPGGGAWSGPKSLRTSGELVKEGKVLGSFEARRATMGGMLGGLKGTCSLMHRNTKALSKDISKWLEKPIMDARLGDLK